jgi:hypothetical protein
MAHNTVSNHFLAAIGFEQLLTREAASHLGAFYAQALTEYKREAQVERARLMRQTPTDYRAVRQMDHELDDVTRRLQEIDAGK